MITDGGIIKAPHKRRLSFFGENAFSDEIFVEAVIFDEFGVECGQEVRPLT